MKQMYMLSIVLLLFFEFVGCTKKEITMQEKSSSVEEAASMQEVSVIEKKTPSLSKEPMSMFETGNILYVASPEGLRMRDKPDITGERIALLEDGQEVAVISIDSRTVVIDSIGGQWVQVEANGQAGWVFNGFLSTFRESEISENENIVIKTELENFAVRYGGNIGHYTGDAITNDDFVFSLVGNERIFSHLGELSDRCIERIVSLSVAKGEWCPVIPPLDERLNLISIILKNNEVEKIDGLAKTKVNRLVLEQNLLTSIEAIGNNPYVKVLDLSGCTSLRNLPDMSGMKNLSMLFLDNTGVTTLDNIETIPHPFTLSLFECTELTDIDDLRRSKVRTIQISRAGYGAFEYSLDTEGTYDRFQDWFEQYLSELEQKERFGLFYFYENID